MPIGGVRLKPIKCLLLAQSSQFLKMYAEATKAPKFSGIRAHQLQNQLACGAVRNLLRMVASSGRVDRCGRMANAQIMRCHYRGKLYH